MSFDEIFDLTAGVYFNFYNIYIYFKRGWEGIRNAKLFLFGVSMLINIETGDFLIGLHFSFFFFRNRFLGRGGYY